MADYAPPQEPPELQDFSPGREKVKYTLGKMLKWAAIGAVVGGIVAAGASLALTAGGGFLGTSMLIGLATAALGAITIGSGPVGWAAIGLLIAAGVAAASAVGIGASTVMSLVGGAFLSAAIPGLLIGAGIGAAISAISGISGAQEAVEEKQEDMMMDHDRNLQRVELAGAVRLKHTQQWIEMQNQAKSLGLTPQPGLPQGLGAEIGRV